MRASVAVAAACALVAFVEMAAAALGPLYGGRITVQVDAIPDRLEPAPARGASARLLSALFHERLCDVRGGVVHPALAESWAHGKRAAEWTIRIRPDSVFHDGAAVDATAVVRSLRRFLRSPSAAAEALARSIDGGVAFREGDDQLPGLFTTGAHDVVFRLRAGAAFPLSSLAAPAAAITSARGAGAGPFVPTTASPIQGRLVAVAFRGHVGGRPFADSVAVQTPGQVHPDPPDITPAIGPGPHAATLLLVVDPAHPAFARAEARRAVSAAIDREDLVRNFLPGGATTLSPLPPLLMATPTRVVSPAARRPLAGSIVLAVSRDVPPVVSQRVIAQLGAAGLRVTTLVASPESVWTTPAAARLVAWAPEVADATLAAEELSYLAPSADAAADAILALAALPIGFRGRPGVHGVAVDDAARIRLENAWLAR